METISHCGDFGDVIAFLACLKEPVDFVLYPHSVAGNRMTPERAEAMIPLLEYQPYIRSARWQEKPEGTTGDDWRHHYNHQLNLADMMSDWRKVPRSHRCHPWLVVPEKRNISKVIIARSPRYNNPKFPWNEVLARYDTEAVFVGLESEHKAFVEAYGKIPYHPTKDLLELAQVIAGCHLFFCNQSCPRWIGEGLKCPVCVEQANPPNTHFDRPCAIYGNKNSGHCQIPQPHSLEELWLTNEASIARDRTLISEDRLKAIARLAEEVQGLDGDFAELGVASGGVCRMLAHVAPHKIIHAYDTFEGLPSDDAFPDGHKKGEFACAVEDVEAFLQGTRTAIHKGLFPQTAVDRRYSLVHLDGDIYQTTKAGIEYFWERIVPGGVMILDDLDWQHCPGVRIALHELLPFCKVERLALQQGFIRKP